MNCPNCRALLQENTVFCPTCGLKIGQPGCEPDGRVPIADPFRAPFQQAGYAYPDPSGEADVQPWEYWIYIPIGLVSPCIGLILLLINAKNPQRAKIVGFASLAGFLVSRLVHVMR